MVTKKTTQTIRITDTTSILDRFVLDYELNKTDRDVRTEVRERTHKN